MNKKFLTWVKNNNVRDILPVDLDNTEFSTCDATGLYSDCYACTVVDTAGFTWHADLNVYDACNFVNADY